MPVGAVPESAYGTVQDVLVRARAMINDAEIPQGDILTDDAPFAMPFCNIAYDQIQAELALADVETFTDEQWLLGISAVQAIDPESRVIVSNTGLNVVTPTGAGSYAAPLPFLPENLLVPMRLWERQSSTTDAVIRIKRPNMGIVSMDQQAFLCEWEWRGDQIIFRGATQMQDVKIRYTAHHPLLQLPTDSVPIRGVNNAAAFLVAKAFAASRGSTLAADYAAEGAAEIFRIKNIAVHEQQHVRVRRQPYSGRRTRLGPFL